MPEGTLNVPVVYAGGEVEKLRTVLRQQQAADIDCTGGLPDDFAYTEITFKCICGKPYVFAYYKSLQSGIVTESATADVAAAAIRLARNPIGYCERCTCLCRRETHQLVHLAFAAFGVEHTVDSHIVLVAGSHDKFFQRRATDERLAEYICYCRRYDYRGHLIAVIKCLLAGLVVSDITAPVPYLRYSVGFAVGGTYGLGGISTLPVRVTPSAAPVTRAVMSTSLNSMFRLPIGNASTANAGHSITIKNVTTIFFKKFINQDFGSIKYKVSIK